MRQPHSFTTNAINELMNKGKSWRDVVGFIVAVIVILSLVSSTLLAEGRMSNNVAINNEQTYKLVTVQEGDSLWQLVTQASPRGEPYILIEQTLKYNNIKSMYLTAGQQIYIPYIQ